MRGAGARRGKGWGGSQDAMLALYPGFNPGPKPCPPEPWTMVLSPGPKPWTKALDQSPGPKPWTQALDPSPGPKPWTQALDPSPGPRPWT